MKTPQSRRKVAIIIVLGLAAFLFFRGRHSSANLNSTEAIVATPSPLPTSCPEKLLNKKVVGVQAGHYKVADLPTELTNLHWDFGASAGGVNEVDVNLDIAQKTVDLLQSKGITAELLPATVPEDYCASAFVAIHADGNDVTSVHGYKVGSSQWDENGKAESLGDNIRQAYGLATNMHLNPTITDNMTQYYAFNSQKFVHAVDSHTPGALIEVGFITNSGDRTLMTTQSAKMAQGVANGISDFLNGKVAPTLAPTASP